MGQDRSRKAIQSSAPFDASFTVTKELLEQFVKHTPAAVAMFDREMRYVLASDRWLRDYGLSGEEIIGRSHYEIFPEIPDHWKEHHRRGLAGEALSEEREAFERHDGSIDWVRWDNRPWYTTDGSVGGLIMFTEVVTERVKAQQILENHKNELEAKNQQLLELSLTDPLTGLNNRRGFHLFAGKIINLAAREGRENLLVFFDLDNLKTVNDTHGHKAGDDMLKTFARTLEETFRASDVVARFGGDEFVALAFASRENTEQLVEERMRKGVARINDEGQHPFELDFTSGCITFDPAEQYCLETLLTLSDSIMYRRKRKKKREGSPDLRGE